MMNAIQSVTSSAVQREDRSSLRQSGVWQKTPAANDSSPTTERPKALRAGDAPKRLGERRRRAREAGAETLRGALIGVSNRQIANAFDVKSDSFGAEIRESGNVSLGEAIRLMPGCSGVRAAIRESVGAMLREYAENVDVGTEKAEDWKRRLAAAIDLLRAADLALTCDD